MICSQSVWSYIFFLDVCSAVPLPSRHNSPFLKSLWPALLVKHNLILPLDYIDRDFI